MLARPAKPLRALREEDDARIEIGFIGGASARLFSCVTIPFKAARAGVVVCPPLHADFAKNYRNEVLLGRALARAELAVIRFHYRGQGHSDGDAKDITLDSLRADVSAAVNHLMETTGATNIAFFGCRLGAFVASAAAASYEGAPLILWEPVLDPSAYLREALRARRIGNIRDDEARRVAPPELAHELERMGHVDIHGYPIHQKLIESLEGRTLAKELGSGRRPVMFVGMGRGDRMRSDHMALIEAWKAAGLHVDFRHVTADVGWWFRGTAQTRDQVDRLATEAVTVTAEWVRAKCAQTGVSR